MRAVIDMGSRIRRCWDSLQVFLYGRRDTHVTVTDLNSARSLLKGHRYAGNFNPHPGPVPHGIHPNDSILKCSVEETPKLRNLYMRLFNQESSRAKVQQVLQQVIGDIKSFSLSELPDMLKTMTNRIGSQILFENELDDQTIEQITFENTNDLEPRIRLATDFMRHSPNAEIHAWIRAWSPSESQIGFSVLTLLGAARFNFSKGLSNLVEALMDQQDTYRLIRNELQELMANGQSFWKAANNSAIIDSVCVESLRNTPVIPQITRQQTISPSEMRTYEISIYSLAHNTSLVGNNPYGFCPMRYINDQKPHWPNHAFLPFGFGRNQCPAWWLYKQTAVYFLATLSMNFTAQGYTTMRRNV
jgi:cytochrome P450